MGLMQNIFLVKLLLNCFYWLSGKTKWQWDDKLFGTLRELLSGSPELVADAEEIMKYGKKGLRSLKKQYKGSKSKTETTKLLFRIIENAPKDKISKVVSSVKKDLKKNANK